MLRARFGAEWAAQPRYASYSQGVREIIRAEGFAALFAGLQPTLLGIMPYSALSFAAFETLKVMLRARAEAAEGADRLSPADELPVKQKLVAGGVAGLFAQTSTYPLHVVRRRMQAGRAPYTSTWQGLQQIYATEGIVGGLCAQRPSPTACSSAAAGPPLFWRPLRSRVRYTSVRRRAHGDSRCVGACIARAPQTRG